MMVNNPLLDEAIKTLIDANFSEGQTRAIIRAIDSIVAMDEETVQRFEKASGELSQMVVDTMELASAASRLSVALSERVKLLEERLELEGILDGTREDRDD